MKKQILISFITVLSTVFSYSALSQAPAIEWQKSLGGRNEDDALAICQTFDGGYIVAGRSKSTSGDVTGNIGAFDAWIVKMSSSGSLEWQKSIGGSLTDQANAIVQTADSGYIIAGSTISNDGAVTGNHGQTDYWVVKLSSAGTVQWQKCYGGASYEIAYSIQQTTDGGYVVGGESWSNDGDVTGNHGGRDCWIVKIDTSGALQWQKSLGGSANDFGKKIRQTADGGYIATVTSSSSDGDVTNNYGSSDFWVVKLSNLGIIQWEKSFGGTLVDNGQDIIQTSDEGYVVIGLTTSNDGDVTDSKGKGDYWVVRISSLGAVVWQKTLGGSELDYATSVVQSTDGGFVVAGYSVSNNGDLTENKGSSDYWLVKLNASGYIVWQKSLGGSEYDVANYFTTTSDGGYIIAGYTRSLNGDVTLNHGSDDFWIVKLKSTVAVPQLSHSGEINVSPNPTTGMINVPGAENATIRVYNTFGQLVKEAQNNNEISLADLPVAMYFIKVFNERGEMIHSGNVVKQ